MTEEEAPGWGGRGSVRHSPQGTGQIQTQAAYQISASGLLVVPWQQVHQLPLGCHSDEKCGSVMFEGASSSPHWLLGATTAE